VGRGLKFLPGHPEVEALPSLYAGWMQTLLPSGIPREGKATCDACAMCAPKGTTGPAEITPGLDTDTEYFDVSTKCCTYAPSLPNFLVGAVLADEQALARDRLEARVRARVAVTPLGVARPTAYGALYDTAADAFGRTRGLLCPYYVAETGSCGIWRHRESVCTTWFCKHERGKVGFSFWRDAMQRLLSAVEEALAKWCVLQLDPGEAALDLLIASPQWRGASPPLTASAIDGVPLARGHDATWGRWSGREAEFFLRCAELVAELDWAQVLAITGAEGVALADATRRAHRRLTTPATPKRPRTAPFQITKVGSETTRVVTYSGFDPLDLPTVALALLPAFDGRPIEEAIAEIEVGAGVRVEPAFVRRLLDFGVLAEATADDAVQ